MLLMRPDVQTLIANGLTSEQKATVLAALRRFIVGGHFNVITAQSEHKEVQEVGDIREAKGKRATVRGIAVQATTGALAPFRPLYRDRLFIFDHVRSESRN
jgi:hypothetical protein